MTTEDTVVTLNGGTYDDLRACMDFIDYMPNLDYLDARAIALNDAETQALEAAPHADKVICRFSLYGRQVTALDTELNLDGVALSGRAEVEQLLARMPRFSSVSGQCKDTASASRQIVSRPTLCT